MVHPLDRVQHVPALAEQVDDQQIQAPVDQMERLPCILVIGQEASLVLRFEFLHNHSACLSVSRDVSGWLHRSVRRVEGSPSCRFHVSHSSYKRTSHASSLVPSHKYQRPYNVYGFYNI